MQNQSDSRKADGCLIWEAKEDKGREKEQTEVEIK